MGYTGLCIAGPLGGQILTHNYPRYAVALVDDPMIPIINVVQDVALKFQTYLYEWHEMLTRHGTAGVWCAPDTDVMTVLLQCYADAPHNREPGQWEG